MNTLQIQFSSSTAFASQIIRRLTHSPFSHVDIVMPTGLLGVSGEDHALHDLGGVLMRPFAPWPYKVKHTVTLNTPIAERIIELANSQLGKPFDHDGLFHFLSDSPGDRNWRNTDKWICSELVAWSLEQAGFFPYTLVSAKDRISPADLLLLINPYLSEDDINGLSVASTV